MEAEKLDGMIVDPETGEVRDVMEYEQSQIMTLDLPKLARATRAVRGRIAIITEYRDQELSRINDICEAKVAKLANQESYLMKRSRDLFKQTDGKAIDYPGLGKYKTIKGREYVSTADYDNMSEARRAEVRVGCSQLFNVKTNIAPNLKEIKDHIKKGTTTIPGFSLERREDRFDFKEEL